MKKSTVFIIVLIVITVLGIIIFKLTKQYDEYKNRNRLDPYIATANNTIGNISSNIIQSDNNINNGLEEDFPPIIERSIDKVSATIKEGTLTRTGVTLIITDNNDIPYVDYDYSTFLYMKKEGKWEPLKPVDYFHSSSEPGHVPTYERITEKDIDWTELYGEIENGEYLLLLRVKPANDNEKSTFGVEFTID